MWAASAQAPAASSPQSNPTKQSTVKPEDMCTIEGVVLKATTADPLKKVILTLRKVEEHGQPKSVTSDASGHFQFKNVEPGRYRLDASRNGYASQEYGQPSHRGSGPILALTAGQHLKEISFRLVPAAVITGHVYDEDGEPVGVAEVQALHFQYEKGQRKLGAFASSRTNDLGEYRIYGLEPGQYCLSASYRPRNEPPEGGYGTVYYPGSADPNRASALDLHPGDELPGIDFTLVPVKTFTVRGRVHDLPSGRPGMHAIVLLEERNRQVRSWSYRSETFVQNPQGEFEIHGVNPGSYYALALSTDGDKQYTAREAIEVSDADVEGVSLVVGPGIDVKGRIRVEGNAPLDMNVVTISLQPREGAEFMGNAPPSIKPDGSFVIPNVADGDCQLFIWGLPEDFYLKAVRAGGSDLLTSDLSVSRKQPPGLLEVVLSPNGAHIEGLVLKEDKPFGGATVVLVPEGDRSKVERLYQSTSTDQDGRFGIRGITPGDYTLFGWETVERGAYQDPEFLRPYRERGKPVHVDDGGAGSERASIHDKKVLHIVRLMPAIHNRIPRIISHAC